MNKEDLHVGMPVKVFDVNAGRRGQPHEGWGLDLFLEYIKKWR